MPQDLTKPPKGSKFRFLSPEKFGFGTSESEQTLIVDWILKTGASAEFTPIRIRLKEKHQKFGFMEKYTWAESPIAESPKPEPTTAG